MCVGETGYDAGFYPGALQACASFFKWELPQPHPQLDLQEISCITTLDRQDAWFSTCSYADNPNSPYEEDIMRTTQQLFDLKGKTALETGGARGPGVPFAEAPGGQGAALLFASVAGKHITGQFPGGDGGVSAVH